MWQVRHRVVGVFMGVSHGHGHYHMVSDCCGSLGVYPFHNQAQIESLFEMADSPHLPESARLKREDFVVEEWDNDLNNLLLDEGVREQARHYLVWSLATYPVGMN